MAPNDRQIKKPANVKNTIASPAASVEKVKYKNNAEMISDPIIKFRRLPIKYLSEI
ncbi:hypothetical protein D3C79_1026940 [compost metagenome]